MVARDDTTKAKGIGEISKKLKQLFDEVGWKNRYQRDEKSIERIGEGSIIW